MAAIAEIAETPLVAFVGGAAPTVVEADESVAVLGLVRHEGGHVLGSNDQGTGLA